MTPPAEQKNVALDVAIAPDFPTAIMIDVARFRQILLNILGNAIKFTEHGAVELALCQVPAKSGGETLRMTVKDRGIGIAADRLQAMFQPFVQADSSTSRRFGGSGLGLSISRQLAECMGGELALDSVLGVGTTVVLTLPLELAQVDSISGDERSAVMVGGGNGDISELVARARGRGGLTILLVEDMELNRRLVAAMLERLGHRVEFASNGAEAVAAAARLKIEPDAWDMILMDIQMPVLNGLEATAQIRALGGAANSIPIVALSANAYASEIRQSHDHGMDDHVTKPVGFKELNRVIERWGRRPPTLPSSVRQVRTARA